MSEKYRPTPEHKKPARASEQITSFFLGLVWGGDPQHDYDYWGKKVNSIWHPIKSAKARQKPKIPRK